MITRTLLRTPSAMGEFLLLFFILLLLFAALLTIVFGPRIEQISTLGIALVNLFQYVITGDGDGFEVQLTH